MKRIHFFEFEDQPWFPKLLRDAMTGFLRVAARASGQGGAMAPTVAALLQENDEDRIVDLCSGGGGPMPELARALAEQGLDVRITLTDWFPSPDHRRGIEAANEGSGAALRFEPEPVDATDVPAHLAGLRTLVNGLHHFRPADARCILGAAARDGAPIAVFETVGRRPLLLLGVLMTPITTMLAIPWVRPFRWAWIPLTYVVPLIPLLVLWDGLVSSFRIYEADELRELVRGLADPDAYHFRIERLRLASLPIEYEVLVGSPQPADLLPGHATVL